MIGACALLSLFMDSSDPVQIRADREEINRRISAFVRRKKEENEVRSLRHYFPIERPPDEPTCARTQCQCICRIACKRQVVDDDQRDAPPDQNTEDEESLSGHAPPMGGVEERVTNLEHHLALEPGKCVPHSMYSRIQKLEERVLYLEGLSPEYFQPDLQGKTGIQVTRESLSQARQTGMLLAHHPVQYSPNCGWTAQKLQGGSSSVDDQNLSLEEIDQRIKNTREVLLSKREASS